MSIFKDHIFRVINAREQGNSVRNLSINRYFIQRMFSTDVRFVEVIWRQ
ncbi:hypothetical protein DR74_4525 [Enterobacter cloacae]|nr:hypothetical protein DR74_4525 [Enterobacter cloacae]